MVKDTWHAFHRLLIFEMAVVPLRYCHRSFRNAETRYRLTLILLSVCVASWNYWNLKMPDMKHLSILLYSTPYFNRQKICNSIQDTKLTFHFNHTRFFVGLWNRRLTIEAGVGLLATGRDLSQKTDPITPPRNVESWSDGEKTPQLTPPRKLRPWPISRAPVPFTFL